MLRTTRLAVYGILTDPAGRILVQRATPGSAVPGSWWLPGGGVRHGEDPVDALRREFAEETGLAVEVTGIAGVHCPVVQMTPQWQEHARCLVYTVSAGGGRPRESFGAGRNLWRRPAELAGEPMSPVTAAILGLEPTPLTVVGEPQPPTESLSPTGLPREQRVGAYAWLTDPDGRVLLTMVPPGYWASGRWHLPGGGVDFGEEPAQTVAREIVEETSQRALLGPLAQIAARHDPESTGPGGAPVDFHGISLIYDGTVPEPSELRIQDVGGSTSEVRWFTMDDIAGLTRTYAVDAAYRRHTGGWEPPSAA